MIIVIDEVESSEKEIIEAIENESDNEKYSSHNGETVFEYNVGG